MRPRSSSLQTESAINRGWTQENLLSLLSDLSQTTGHPQNASFDVAKHSRQVAKDCLGRPGRGTVPATRRQEFVDLSLKSRFDAVKVVFDVFQVVGVLVQDAAHVVRPLREVVDQVDRNAVDSGGGRRIGLDIVGQSQGVFPA